MSERLFKKIINELSRINYSGRISLFEMNEPLTEPRLVSMVAYAKKKVPGSWQLLITNADLLTGNKAAALISAGVDYILISSYSKDDLKKNDSLINGLPGAFRKRILNRDLSDPSSFAHDNRCGNLSHIGRGGGVSADSCSRVNHILYVKPDGKVVSCFGDFFNRNVFGDAGKQTLRGIWFGDKFSALRRSLDKGDRKVNELCRKCNIDETGMYARKADIERMLREDKRLNGAIVGSSVSAGIFYPYLAKYSNVKFLVSRSGYRHCAMFLRNRELVITDDYPRVLSDRSLDYVFVANPNAMHYQAAKMAILAGKHVLIEKPLALRLKDIDKLDVLRRKKKVVMAGVFQWRFLDSVRVAGELLTAGRLGEPLFINARLLWKRESDYFRRGRGTWETDGGGVLIKQAIHGLDVMLCLAGKAVSWRAYGSNAAGGRKTEDSVLVSFKFKKGFGSLSATVVNYADLAAEIEIVGTKGRFVFNSNDEILSWDLPFPPPRTESPVSPVEKQVINFIDSVNGWAVPVVGARESRMSLGLILDIYKSKEFKKGMVRSAVSP